METITCLLKEKKPGHSWFIFSSVTLVLAMITPFAGLAFVDVLNERLDVHSEVIRCEVVGSPGGGFDLYAIKPRSRYLLAKGLKTTTNIIDTRFDLCPFPKYPKCTGAKGEQPRPPEDELWKQELLTWTLLSTPSELSGTFARRISSRMG